MTDTFTTEYGSSGNIFYNASTHIDIILTDIVHY